MGYLAEQGNFEPKTLKEAMAYGILAASFTVEDFSLDRLQEDRAGRPGAAHGGVPEDAELLTPAMKQTIRTFVAVEMDACNPQGPPGPDREVPRGRGRGELGRAREHAPDAEVPRRRGDADDARGCARRSAGAVAGVAPFDLEIRGAGAFPNPARPRVIWLGSAEGQEPMADLAERIESALEKLGFPREDRRFHAHLTLGRVRRGGPAVSALASLVQEHADAQIGRTPVDEVVIFSSQLKPTGAIYEALDRAELGGS